MKKLQQTVRGSYWGEMKVYLRKVSGRSGKVESPQMVIKTRHDDLHQSGFPELVRFWCCWEWTERGNGAQEWLCSRMSWTMKFKTTSNCNKPPPLLSPLPPLLLLFLPPPPPPPPHFLQTKKCSGKIAHTMFFICLAVIIYIALMLLFWKVTWCQSLYEHLSICSHVSANMFAYSENLPAMWAYSCWARKEEGLKWVTPHIILNAL